MPEEEKALPDPSLSSDDGPSTRRSMTSGLREAPVDGSAAARPEADAALDDPGVTPMVAISDLVPSAPASTPEREDAPAGGSETTLVSSPSSLSSTPRSSRRGSRRSQADASSPSSARSPNVTDEGSRAWIAVWVVAGLASVAVGVYLALHG